MVYLNSVELQALGFKRVGKVLKWRIVCLSKKRCVF